MVKYIIVPLTFLITLQLYSANRTWTNANNTGLWSDGANWSGGKPGSNDKAVFDGTSTANCTIDENINVKGIDINSGYTGTITQSGAFTITIGTDDYNQADGTFIGGSGDINLNTGTFTISNGLFRSTSGTLFFDENFTISGGHFQHNNGTVEFDDNNNKSLNLNVIDTFYNFNMSPTSDNKRLNIQSNDTMLVENKLYCSQGRIQNNHIIIQNELEITSGYDIGTATIWFKGSGPINAYGSLENNQHTYRVLMDNDADTAYFYDTDGSLAIGKTDRDFYLSKGVVSFAKNNTSVNWDSREISLDGGVLIACPGTTSFQGIWDNNGGKFVNSNGTWKFDANNHRSYTSTEIDTFYNLIIDASSNNKEMEFGLTDTFVVANKLTLNQGGFEDGFLLLLDTIQVNSGFDNNNANSDVIFIGGLTADYLDNGGALTEHDLIVSKTPGTSVQFWDMSGDGDVDLGGSGNDMIVNSGTVDFTTASVIDIDYGDFNRTGGVINSTSGTVKISGNQSVTGGSLVHNNGTWEFDFPEDRTYIFTGVKDTLYNMTINSSDNSNKDYLLTGSITIQNKMRIQNGGAGSGLFEILDTLEVNNSGEQTVSTGYLFLGSTNGVFYTNGDDIDKNDIIIAKTNGASVQFVSSASNFTSGSSSNKLSISSGTADFSLVNDVNLSFNVIQLDGGFLKASPADMSITGNWDNNGGKFLHNNGRFTLNYNNDLWESVVPDTFNVLILDGNGGGKEITAEADDEIVILDTLFMTEGEGFFNATFKPAGNIIMGTGWRANAAQGTMEFTGGNAQILDFSAGTSDFDGDITLNKSGGSSVTLASNLALNGSGQTFTFTAGYLISNSSNELYFSDNNATCTGMSNASFVNGTVRKRNNSTFTFPVGNNGVYGPITLSPTGTSTEFRASYFKSTPTDKNDVSGNLNNISENEYWDVERTNTSNSATVTLEWNASRSGLITDISKIVVAHYTGGSWVNEGGNNISGNAVIGSVQSNTISNFSPFTLGSSDTVSNSNPLPVELKSFKASPNTEENVVDLFWVTSSELNNEYFTIEKTKDLKTFTQVAVVPGQGTTNQETEYYEKDYNTAEGVYYYRLSQTDFDGTTTFFDLEKVLFNIEQKENDIHVELYPNPNNGHNMFLKIPNSDSEEINVLVNDFIGKSYPTDFTVINQGEYSVVAIEMNQKLAAGSYMINVSVDGENHSHKLIVK